jgi:hypothetical protein
MPTECSRRRGLLHMGTNTLRSCATVEQRCVDRQEVRWLRVTDAVPSPRTTLIVRGAVPLVWPHDSRGTPMSTTYLLQLPMGYGDRTISGGDGLRGELGSREALNWALHSHRPATVLFCLCKFYIR